MSTSRHHHYLSQCYLKGFTQGGGKKSKLTVIDLKEKKEFTTIPRNVGGVRDFNRIEIEGIDPEIVEKIQSEFESEAATALKKLGDTFDFSGKTRDLILELIGMLAIKTPEMRAHLAKPMIEIGKRMMAINLENRESWESQKDEVKNSTGEDIFKNISYEEMKEFFDRKAGVRSFIVQITFLITINDNCYAQ